MNTDTRSRADWLLTGAIIAEVIATLTLKAALERPILYVVVLVGYIATFVLLDRVLRAGMALGVAYGVWGAVGVAATAMLSALLFDESLSARMLLGIAVIAAGVLCIELGGRRR
ncbi:DMT family transporter [Corynebacterium guangdongense]|uniref:Small multidrug resistance pump n=1 Tax=Corynebacterium guangdongense TaxID=1783348 RepID=A0ABU2A132_9CORY|nr:SMR family transporter [Corynebacterium guangdongense]MDR7330725.1 small multidrug resistance pump [Corynebacterium guangdongense]WJZ16740.1 Spermidine export protein MdtJ [Corynebacterium guangdongense]